jgi:hypothetical protein
MTLPVFSVSSRVGPVPVASGCDALMRRPFDGVKEGV